MITLNQFIDVYGHPVGVFSLLDKDSKCSKFQVVLKTNWYLTTDGFSISLKDFEATYGDCFIRFRNITVETFYCQFGKLPLKFILYDYPDFLHMERDNFDCDIRITEGTLFAPLPDNGIARIFGNCPIVEIRK